MEHELTDLLASIDKLPYQKPLREFAEILSEFTSALSNLASNDEPVRALLEVKTAVQRLAELQAAVKPGATEEQIRAVVAGANVTTTVTLLKRLDEIGQTLRAISNVAETVNQASTRLETAFRDEIESLRGTLQSQPAAAVPVADSKGKPSLAQLRKVVLAPVHLEVDVQRNIAGRIERFIVNEV